MPDRFEIVSGILEKEFAKPYVAGKSDCFVVTLRIADALNGTKYVKKYSNKYKTIKQAQIALKKEGFDSLEEFYASLFEQRTPAMAGIGDIVVISLEGLDHGGVCFGQQFFAKTENGKESFPLNMISAAFKV